METEDQLAAVTQSKAKEFQLKWTIEDFSFAFAKNKTAGTTRTIIRTSDVCPLCSSKFANETCHSSPDFQFKFNCDNVKTRITLQACDNHLSANLKFIELKENMLFKWEFILFNSRCEKLADKAVSRAITCSQGDETNWNFLINWENLVKGISHDDKLILICNLKVSTGNYQPKIISGPSVPDFQSCILNDFAKLRMNGDFSDMTISVCEKEFHVHKMILAARSPVFASMFKHEMKEAKLGKLEIKDMEHKVFEELLDFIYKGKAKVDEYEWELLEAAEKYDVQDLKSICEDFLVNNITKENCLKTLVYSDLLSAEKLKKIAMNFIVANAVQIDKTELAHWRNQLKDSSLILELTEALMNRK